MSTSAGKGEAQQAMQRDYYARTAAAYDESHLAQWSEHDLALAFVAGLIPALGISSVLDIGSGTGRALARLKQQAPHLRIVGIEPSPELRHQGHSKGLAPEELTEGDAQNLSFADGEFDFVTEFGVLHHVPDPARVVTEMLRVAKRGILISDANNVGQGSGVSRTLKQAFRAVGLWRAFDLARTRGKGYMISEEDGLFYSYSVFDNLPQIRAACKSVHLLSTQSSGANLFRTAPHVVVLGLK